MINNLLMTDFMTGLFGLGFGMLVVFLGIALLIFIIWLTNVILENVSGKGKKVASDEAVSEAVSVATREAEIPSEEADDATPAERAAIIAAVTACYVSEQSKRLFTVRKVKRLR